jgi:DNA-binding NtrC family response regulator
MIELEDANILYLDNDQKHLDKTKEEFEANGYKLKTTRDVGDAKFKAISEEVNVFLCDLRLEPITTTRGLEILQTIRRKNENVFLAIFSAYTKEFKTADYHKLSDNNIYTYTKDDTHRFLLNLNEDFKNFQEQKIKKDSIAVIIPSNEDLASNMKKQVIASLRSLSNPNIILPIRGHEKYNIVQIITAIEDSNDIGQIFVNDWIEAIGKMKNL